METNINTNTYTMMSACTPEGREAPLAFSGWSSIGYTPVGSCLISSPPGDGHLDSYNIRGYNRISKRTVPSTGDMGIDCCSDLYGISESLECKARGYSPYSKTCDAIMVDACNSSVNQDP